METTKQLPLARNFKGVLIATGKYKFTENTDAQRNTDKIIFDERLRGLVCYVKKIIDTETVEVEIPGQKGWSTPVNKINVQSNWLESCL